MNEFEIRHNRPVLPFAEMYEGARAKIVNDIDQIGLQKYPEEFSHAVLWSKDWGFSDERVFCQDVFGLLLPNGDGTFNIEYSTVVLESHGKTTSEIHLGRGASLLGYDMHTFSFESSITMQKDTLSDLEEYLMRVQIVEAFRKSIYQSDRLLDTAEQGGSDLPSGIFADTLDILRNRLHDIQISEAPSEIFYGPEIDYLVSEGIGEARMP